MSDRVHSCRLLLDDIILHINALLVHHQSFVEEHSSRNVLLCYIDVLTVKCIRKSFYIEQLNRLLSHLELCHNTTIRSEDSKKYIRDFIIQILKYKNRIDQCKNGRMHGEGT